MQILTPPGEMAFVSVFRPAEAMEEGKDPQYQLTLVWDADEPALDALEEAIEKVATAKWGKKASAMLKSGQLKTPLRDGEEREADWLQGKRFLTARSSEKPDVVDEDVQDIIDTKEVYAGAIGRMDVWLYAFEKRGNKGVSAILNNVQKLGDGERKGGRRRASEAFESSAPNRSSRRRGKARTEEDEEEAPRSRQSSTRAGARRARR